VKRKTFSTLTFKINISGKQDKQKCKPFNCLFEALHTSQPGVMCYDIVTSFYILQEFLEFYAIIRFFFFFCTYARWTLKASEYILINSDKRSKLYTSPTLNLMRNFPHDLNNYPSLVLHLYCLKILNNII
jgi:hypothetical protein